MFLTADEGPVASGHGEAASKATLQYIQAVDTAVRALWLDHADEIKQRCAASMPLGLLDQQEVFGFALADGLGRPIIPGGRARDIGQAGDDAIKGAKGTPKRPGPLPRAKEAAREALRKANAKATKDASLAGAIADVEKDGDAAVAKVLSKTYDLKLPNETVGAKRKLAATLPAVPTPTPEEPSLADLRGALIVARRAASKAQEAADATAQCVLAAEHRAEKAHQRLDALGPPPSYPRLDPKTDPPSESFGSTTEWLQALDAITEARIERHVASLAPWTRAEKAVRAADVEVCVARRDARRDRRLLAFAEWHVSIAQRRVAFREEEDESDKLWAVLTEFGALVDGELERCHARLAELEAEGDAPRCE